MNKNTEARNAAMGEYFQHWDGKAEDETESTRKARAAEYASLTRQ